jgi:glycosyltransferase involved in cell wall biosynthesis
MCLFTRFPVFSETFLQREVEGLLRQGLPLQLVTLWGGDSGWKQAPVEHNHLVDALKGLLWLPYWLVKRPRVIGHLLSLVWRPRRSGILNWGENLLGAGYALQSARRWQSAGITHLHAVWASAPAMAAYALHLLTGIPFSFAAHAYDLFEHGGDGWLREKGRRAEWVRSSTSAGCTRAEALGIPCDKLVRVRRGLPQLPPPAEERIPVAPFRFLSVGRMVEKMGFSRQIPLYCSLKEAGLRFHVAWIGDGPERPALEAAVRAADLQDTVEFLGRQPFGEVEAAYRRSDCLVFTGCIDRNGDRAGLPNTVAEAMAWGLLVFVSDVGAVSEAVRHGVNGYVWSADPDPAIVLKALADPAAQLPLRRRAREWAMREYNLRVNLARLKDLLSVVTFAAPRG